MTKRRKPLAARRPTKRLQRIKSWQAAPSPISTSTLAPSSIAIEMEGSYHSPMPPPLLLAAPRFLKDLAGAESSTTAVSVALADDESILWAEAFGSIDQPDA